MRYRWPQLLSQHMTACSAAYTGSADRCGERHAARNHRASWLTLGWVLVVFACWLCTAPAQAQSGRRVALLIGNAAYTGGMPALSYPLQDVSVLEQSLKRLNFEVQVVRNADQRAMGRAIRDFGTSAREAQVALVYYSGHGMQARDENYLIPVGASVETEGDLEIEAVSLRALMRQIEDARPRTAVVVLDACRDNPVAARTKSGTKGLSRVQNPPNNTLVVFAALPGTTATDNGVFAKELASRIVEPNVGIRTVFDKVGQAVRQATNQRQAIQRDDQLNEDVVLVATARVEAVVPAPGPNAEQIEQQAWEAARGGNSAPAYNAYLAEYPRGRFASVARVELARLQSAPQPAVPAPAPTPPPASVQQAGQVFKDCAQCPEMVVVPAGSFTMGSSAAEQALANAGGLSANDTSRESPQHTVRVRSFAAGRYAVTRGEFGAFVQARGYVTEAEQGDGCFKPSGTEWKKDKATNWRNAGFAQSDDHPVVCVSWNDAKAYAQWVSQSTGKEYRLLSEAEREYAARGGRQSAFWWGDSITTGQANYHGTSRSYNGSPKGGWRRATVAVGSFRANPYGLYNVHGNVWEWVEDCFHENYNGAPTDGSAWTTGCSGDFRVLRGGSWDDYPANLRSASRSGGTPGDRDSSIGFRLARTLITP
jgi:formylglycine-generating enzyme required for sulfatase activity